MSNTEGKGRKEGRMGEREGGWKGGRTLVRGMGVKHRLLNI